MPYFAPYSKSEERHEHQRKRKVSLSGNAILIDRKTNTIYHAGNWKLEKTVEEKAEKENG